MKSIIDIINEKLKINSSSKISEQYNINVLNKNIDTLEELKNVLETYFGIKATPIKNKEISWKFELSTSGILVNNYFEFKFKDETKNKVTKRLRCGIFHNCFVIQELHLYKKWEQHRIHGMSPYEKFEIGNNLKDFIMHIKKLTDENHGIVKDQNLMDLFQL